MSERREGNEPKNQLSAAEITASYPNIEIPSKENIEAQQMDETEFMEKVNEAINGAFAAIGEEKLKKMNIKFSAFGYGSRVGMQNNLVIGGADSSEKMIKAIIDNQDNKQVEFVPDDEE